MNRNWTYVVVALATALAASATAWGQPQGPGRGPGGRGFAPGPIPMLRHLDLSEAQRTQIREIVETRREGESAPGRKLRELHQQLHQAIFADVPDLAKIEELKGALAAAEAAALDARIDTQLKIAQVLTSEQRATARESTGPGRARR